MSTVLGIILGIALLIGSVWVGGGYEVFVNPLALMIVLGGTIAATLISFRLPTVLNIFRIAVRLFRYNQNEDLKGTVARLVELGHKASESSIYDLESELNEEPNHYISMGLGLLIKDFSHQKIARCYAIEVEGVKVRHQQGIRLFGVMAKVAPSFGLVGTLIGLINMLRGISSDISPETLGPSMAVAMVTTLYGALFSFLFFLPASEKLKDSSAQEIAHISMVRDGILMIKDGYSPRDLEQMLNAYLAKRGRESTIDQLAMKSDKKPRRKKKKAQAA